MKRIHYYLILFFAASILNGCGLYTRYSRPELDICTDSLYRSAVVQTDSSTIASNRGVNYLLIHACKRL